MPKNQRLSACVLTSGLLLAINCGALAQSAPTVGPRPKDTPPTRPAAAPPATPAPAPSAAPSAATNSSPAPTPPAALSPADQIMRDLEQAARTREGNAGVPGGAATPGAPANATSAPSAGGDRQTGRLMREGAFVTNRRGRMNRGASGEFLFSFDGDANGKVDPAMVLMPSMNLAAMERLFDKGGDSVSFTISGQVFLYKGRNHMLPTVFQVNRRTELSPNG